MPEKHAEPPATAAAAIISYYRARYYDPQSGRFVNEDPIGFDAGINFYVYVKNGPLNLVDPTGTSDACTFGGCSGAHKALIARCAVCRRFK